MSHAGSRRYNSPPNWPAPPSDWTPPPDWQPDPSWPPAPKGWQFWVDRGPAAAPDTDPRRCGPELTSWGAPTVRPALQTINTRARTVGAMVRVVVNPPRALYAGAAVAGAVLFVWMFILVRFNAEWTFSGWMWDGVWPVAAMGVGLVVAVGAGVRAWQWDYVRWTQRHRAPAEPAL